MRGVGVNVQLSRHASPLQREVHEYAILRRTDDILAPVHEEKWRRIRWDMKARGKFLLILRFEIAGIDRNRQVRSATDFVNVIDGVVGSLVEARRGRRHQMPTRRKTN